MNPLRAANGPAEPITSHRLTKLATTSHGPRVLVCMVSLLALASSADAASTHYQLYFDKPGIEGSFDYDADAPMFSNFLVTFTHTATIQDPYMGTPHPLTITQVDSFDFTAWANLQTQSNFSFSGGMPVAAIGLTYTPADTFRLLAHGFPGEQIFPDFPDVRTTYTMGGGRRPGLGSPAGDGWLNFGVSYCAPPTICADGGAFLLGGLPNVSNVSFTTTASPYGTSDPNLMLSWTDGASFALVPFVPEPGTWALLAAGLGALMLRTATRKPSSGRSTCLAHRFGFEDDCRAEHAAFTSSHLL